MKIRTIYNANRSGDLTLKMQNLGARHNTGSLETTSIWIVSTVVKTPATYAAYTQKTAHYPAGT
jgi:hypothetical protein